MYAPMFFSLAPVPSRAAAPRYVASHHAKPRVREGDPPTDATRTFFRELSSSAVTWLTLRERGQMDAAIGNRAVLVHRDALRTARADLGFGSIRLAVVSAERVRVEGWQRLARIVRDFPNILFVGLVVEGDEEQVLASAAALGRAGIDRLVDCRRRDGWSEFRELLQARRIEAWVPEALNRVLGDLHITDRDDPRDAPGAVRLFTLLFAPHVTSVTELATELGVAPAALASRFQRAGLQPPSRYLAYIRMVRAAHLGEIRGLTMRTIAERVGASSAQSYGRSVLTTLGMTAAEFRAQLSGAATLDRFRQTLVVPYRDRLRRFDPTGEGRERGRIEP